MVLFQDFLERHSNVVDVAMDNHAGIAYDTKVCIPELNHKYNRVIDFRVGNRHAKLLGQSRESSLGCTTSHNI